MNKANSPNDFQETLKRNKPSIVLPIINTVFAFALFIFILIYTLNGSFTIWYFLLFTFILIMFPMASWYNSYFSKKKNTSKINAYQHETTLLVKYAQRYKNYYAIDVTSSNNLLFEPQISPIDDFSIVTFNKETCLFKEHDPATILITLGITFCGLSVNEQTFEVEDIQGFMPSSIWYYKHLNVPKAVDAKMIVNFGSNHPSKRQVYKMLNRADTYYDKKTGWLLIGERKITSYDDAYKVFNNVIMVLRDKELISIFIQIESNITF